MGSLILTWGLNIGMMWNVVSLMMTFIIPLVMLGNSEEAGYEQPAPGSAGGSSSGSVSSSMKKSGFPVIIPEGKKNVKLVPARTGIEDEGKDAFNGMVAAVHSANERVKALQGVVEKAIDQGDAGSKYY